MKISVQLTGSKMIRFIAFFAGLFIGFLPIEAFAGENESDFRHLKAPQFKWEDSRLTGEVKDVPVIELLEELSWKEGFELKIFGKLDQKTNISFDHLTVEECIKKIMRTTGLSYIIISGVAGSSDTESTYRISKLIVCQKGKRSHTPTKPRPRPRRTKRRVKRKPPPKVKEQAVSPRPDEEGEVVYSPREASKERAGRRKKILRRARAEFEGNPEDLKDYLDQLSSEGKLTPQDQKMILERMK